MADHHPRTPGFPETVLDAIAGEAAADAPTALVVSTDGTAARILRAALDRGYRIPQDLALVGYNNSQLASAVRPALTSINQPRNAMGKQAMQFLLERLAGNTEQRVTIMTPELVVRGSSSQTQG